MTASFVRPAILLLLAAGSPLRGDESSAPSLPYAVPAGDRTGVSFQTSDAALQRLLDSAAQKEAGNIVSFTPALRVLVEGGGYDNAWIETQPMGGEMYAKRDVQVALNNQVIFMLTQRSDGRLPGMVVSGEAARRAGQDRHPPEGRVWLAQQDLEADYEMLQGYCFPDPAWRMYFWSGRNRAYLRRLYTTLAAYDAYLWRTRNPKGDGLLETWCVWDTGEDNDTRLTTRFAPTRWPFDFAPVGERLPDPKIAANYDTYWFYQRGLDAASRPSRDQVLAPFASMDIMGYSYDGRATLAKIARELGDGRASFWQGQAAQVRQNLINGLWDPGRHACFDRDRTGKVLPELVHDNLRAMYHGLFTQAMADAFIRYHLLNPAEFWTPMPLPSIAVNDPLFRNDDANDWSGQPEGLTYQRAIRALENYGHVAEITLLGRKLIAAVEPSGRFTQQFDPFTTRPTSGTQDDYGPTILAVLEYGSLMAGVHVDVEKGELAWSGLADGGETYTYSQRWGNRTWKLVFKEGAFTGFLNSRALFSCTAGVRVLTDLDGNVRGIVGIDSVPHAVTVRVGDASYRLTVAPNEVRRLDGTVLRAVPFDYPYREK